MTMIFDIGYDVTLTVDAPRALSYLICRFTTYQNARRVKLVDGLDCYKVNSGLVVYTKPVKQNTLLH